MRSDQYNKFIEELPKELNTILLPSTAQKAKKEQKNAIQELEKFKRVIQDKNSSKDVLEETLNFIKSIKEHIEQEEVQNE